MNRAGGAQFAISPLVKVECLVDPTKRADKVLERVFSELFDLLVPPSWFTFRRLIFGREADSRPPMRSIWLVRGIIDARRLGPMKIG